MYRVDFILIILVYCIIKSSKSVRRSLSACENSIKRLYTKCKFYDVSYSYVLIYATNEYTTIIL